MTEKHAARGKRGSGSSSRGKMWVGAGIAVLVILGAVLGLRQQGVVAPSGDILTAESTTFDFGQIKMTGGLVRTKFPLKVQGSPLVTGLITN